MADASAPASAPAIRTPRRWRRSCSTRRRGATPPQGRPEREYTDDDLMVVGDEVSLAAAFRQGGVSLLVALMAVAVVQSLDNAALGVLAPDIQDSLGVSSAVLGAIGGAAGVLFVMGAIPIAALADRRRRTTIAGVVHARLRPAVDRHGGRRATPSGCSLARMGSGLAASHILPVHNSLLADAYPIRARGRIYSIYGLGTPIGQLLGPVAVGAHRQPRRRRRGLALGLRRRRRARARAVAVRRDPPRAGRGMNEQIAVLGETIEAERSPVPISTSIAFGRLKQISTFRYMLIGIGALGFGLFSVPIFLNVFMEDTLRAVRVRARRGRVDRRRARRCSRCRSWAGSTTGCSARRRRSRWCCAPG